jgi:hypothetical protein
MSPLQGVERYGALELGDVGPPGAPSSTPGGSALPKLLYPELCSAARQGVGSESWHAYRFRFQCKLGVEEAACACGDRKGGGPEARPCDLVARHLQYQLDQRLAVCAGPGNCLPRLTQ